MAATEDRVRTGKVKVTPETFSESVELAADEVIYAHTLAVIRDDNGLLESAAAGSAGTVVYADKHLEDYDDTGVELGDDVAGTQMEHGAGRVKSAVVALLNCADAVDASNVGDTVYVSDNDTVTLTQGASEPEVGKITRVVDADEVWVHIPGLLG